VGILRLATILLLLQVGTPSETASIEGVVLRSGSGEPLSRAEVKLTRVVAEEEAGGKFSFGSDPDAGLPSALTGSDGKFLLKDIDPGKYRLVVARNGYAKQSYGQTFPTRPGAIISITPGQAMKEVQFRMVPAGVVTGRVRDSSGEPGAGLSISLMQIAYDGAGRKTLEQFDEARTDDRGEYRFFWIPQGRYYVKASRAGHDFGRKGIVTDRTLRGTYYPGVLDASRASVIEVQPGSEIGAIDIVLPQVLAHSITGRVVDASTGKPPKSVDIGLIPRLQNEILDYDTPGAEYDSTKGTFIIRNVVPGPYRLVAGTRSGFEDPLPAADLAEARTGADLLESMFMTGASTQIPIEMPSADLHDVVLTLSKGSSIPVRFALDGQAFSTANGVDEIRLYLEPEAEFSFAFMRSGRPNSEGNTKMDNALPGEYRVQVALGRAKDFYVKELRYGRTDALNEPIQITDQAPAGLTVLLSNKGGQIEGTLRDALSQPVGGVEVMLIPNERKKRELYKRVETDQDGRFVFRSLPPGGYKVFSWEALEPNAYYDIDVVSRYETQGRPVQIQELSKETVDLRIIPAPAK
jgi:5-hydroxyisourate hydrolase-like protein (transthyretin family)